MHETNNKAANSERLKYGHLPGYGDPQHTATNFAYQLEIFPLKEITKATTYADFIISGTRNITLAQVMEITGINEDEVVKIVLKQDYVWTKIVRRFTSMWRACVLNWNGAN